MLVTTTIKLETVRCWVCGCEFAVDSTVLDNKKRYDKTLHCPNGCLLGFGETPEQKLRKEMEQKLAEAKRKNEYLEAREKDQRKRADRAQRQLNATRGVVTRIKNRVSKGVCPCCNRTFLNLQRHMATKHPKFKAQEVTLEETSHGGE